MVREAGRRRFSYIPPSEDAANWRKSGELPIRAGEFLAFTPDGAQAPLRALPSRSAAVRVVIAHEFYETGGGAERVTAEIAATFPAEPVYASVGRRSVARRMGIEDRVSPLLLERSGAPTISTFGSEQRVAESEPGLLSIPRSLVRTTTNACPERLRSRYAACQWATTS